MIITKEAALSALADIFLALPRGKAALVTPVREFIEQSEAGDRDAARLDWLEAQQDVSWQTHDGLWRGGDGLSVRVLIDAAIQSSKVGESQK